MSSGIDIEAAAARLAGRVRVTPVVRVEPTAFGLDPDGAPVVLKLELLQHTGSFKPRGALNRVLSVAETAGEHLARAGVIAASGGNHGLAVAHAARTLGLRAEVFVPESSSPVKVAGIERLGAEVTVTGRFYADALRASERRAEETGALVVHAYDQPEVVAGQGTVGRELHHQLTAGAGVGPHTGADAGTGGISGGDPGVDTVLVAVGGGGLLAGVATWLRDAAGAVRVVAVEPERAPTLATALTAGAAVDVDVGGVAADSLGARRIGGLALDVARRAGVRSVLVSDEAILHARQELWVGLRVAAEAGGATALAALTSGAYRPAPDERVAVIVCGANTDPGDLVARAGGDGAARDGADRTGTP